MAKLNIKRVESFDFLEPRPEGKVQVNAKILYEEIQKEKDGLYVWLSPDAESILKLQRLLKTAPFKTHDCVEMHCTLLYCRDVLPIHVEVPDDRACTAQLQMIDTWVDHKMRNIAVGRLASPDIMGVHQQLLSQGLAHGHPDYNPHITFGKGLELNIAEKNWLAQANAELRASPLTITFDKVIKGATCC